MAIQISVPVRNARLDAIEAQIGANPILEIRTGGQPANCAAAATGTLLASLSLPADWLEAAAAGSKSKSGTWTDLLANAGGDAEHFRIYASDGVTCGMQGRITVTGGGGDMTIAGSVTLVLNQQVTVTGFVLTDDNA